jgi:streptogramin lyase
MSKEIGNRFRDHGVASPISNHRGTVATVDAAGRDVVLVWLFDHRGGYALLMIDVETGKTDEIPMPFPPGGDCPYASILSSRNRFYTHFNGFLAEFDVAKRVFTFHHATARQMAMSMTEDDAGRIWLASYPNSGVVSYDPATGEFRDYGHLYAQNWAQYPRSIAADDTGWIYFGIGSTSGQIIALDPVSGRATPVIPEAERVQGSGTVYRDLNGKVYGHPGGESKDGWIELHRGAATTIGALGERHEKPYIASSQGLFHRQFPNGRVLQACDLTERLLRVEDPKTGKVVENRFAYTSDGAHLMGVATAPDGTICGGTAFPMRFFSFNPRTDSWINRETWCQCNTLARQGDRFFVGGYTGGFLLEWDPAKPWVRTEKDNPQCNPVYHTDCKPTINRPHGLLAHPDGHYVILAGTPDYGYTGGGLLIWNRKTGERVLLDHNDLLPQHSTMSLAPLSGGKLLAGTTTMPGTGGEKKVHEAELYILDLATQRLEWHEPVLPGIEDYMDLRVRADGLVYGLANRRHFFVFDPVQRKVIHRFDTEPDFGVTNVQQGPRVFVQGEDGTVFILFVKGIARIDPKTFSMTMLVESPAPIGPGGDYLDGRIYFGSGSHLYSWAVG